MMEALRFTLQGLLGLTLTVFGVYSLLAVEAARRWHRARQPLQPDWTPPVTILKPVRGFDVEAYENFASYCRQDYPADCVQILFGARDANDPALELACRLQKDFPTQNIGVIACDTDRLEGYNFKIGNLAVMLRHARHDLLVLNDSDIRVAPDYLRRIVAPFAPNYAQARRRAGQPPPSVGMVTCPYRGVQARSLAAKLEALSFGADYIPSAFVSRWVQGMGWAFGPTMVIPRAILTEIGGFEALADELADDFRLGEWTRRAGHEVILSDFMIENVLGDQPFAASWTRRLRWARTIRACRPLGYAGSLATHGAVLALLFLFVSGFSPLGWWVFALTCGLRLTTALVISRRYTRDASVTRLLPLLPLSDLLQFALFVVSYCGNTVRWRGEPFVLLRGGKLTRRTP